MERITKYDVHDKLECENEALFDGHVYAIRWSNREGCLEAVYAPGTPDEEQLDVSSIRTDLMAAIAADVNYRRYEARPRPLPTVEGVIADLTALDVAGMSLEDAAKLAYAMGGIEPLVYLLGAVLESRIAEPVPETVVMVPCNGACGNWGPDNGYGYTCPGCRESHE